MRRFFLALGLGAAVFSAVARGADKLDESVTRIDTNTAPKEALEDRVAGQDLWDETGVDYPIPEIPDVSEVSPAVAAARSVARAAALDAGFTEEQADQAAFAIPEDLEQRKSPHQLALEEHAGEDPSDVEKWDPTEPPRRSVLPSPRVKPLAPKAIESGKRVLGWHPYWATTADIQGYQYSNLTTIAYFSYEVNPTNGGYYSIHSWNTTPVVEWAHSSGVKVVLTATLFGSTDNQRLLTNSSACNNLVSNLLTVVSNRGGDGVCIDFESVGSWAGATVALTAFMSNLTTRFHAADPEYEVSIALPSVDWYADFAVSNYDRAGLDYAVIMGYDYYYSGSATPGPNAPLYSSAQWIGASSWCSVNYSMNYYLGKGISSNKLMLGVPYYGRRWAAVSTNLGAASLGSAYSAALTYGQCETAAATYGKKWDSNASVPYYVYTLNSTNYQCFYDDTVSLGLKYDLSNTKSMGGIGIWNLSQGTGETELWDLIYEKFGEGAGDPVDPGGGDTGGSSATAAWTNRTSAHTGHFYGVGSRNGLHVASGAGGAIYTSTNGIQWVARSSGKSGLLMNVNGNGPLWVVVGESGAIVTSTNGYDWVSRTSPTNALFRGIAYGNGIYVACGDNGAIVRSTDGATWTSIASGTANSLQGVGYGVDYVNLGDTNGAVAESPQFIIVGASGLIMTSTNGTSWTTRTSGTTVWLSDVMYGNGYFVAVGNTRILRSADGISWTLATNNTYLYRAAYCSGVFKTTGANGAIWTSENGTNWEAETSGTTNTLRGISYANDQFVAVGFNGTILTKGTMAGLEEEGGGEEGGGEGETGGGEEPLGTPDETGLPQVAAAQPVGPLSGVVVYTSAGHGFGADADLTEWIPERPLLYAVNEDIGNVDQMNRFAEAAWKAGATVVPFRPVGHQTNEVVLDNMNTNAGELGRVTFGGTWYNSTQSIFYGNSGDAISYRYAAISTNSSTSWASYRPTLPVAGDYPVYTWVRHGSDRANQLYRIYHSGGVTDVRVNHRDVGCGWVWLGTYYFNAGTNGCVNIGNYTPGGAADTYVFADAIRFGNGMGTTSRGTAGYSGFESELESSRFWTIKSMGQGMDSSLYDLAGYDDRSDNIGQPARMAAYMCRSNDASRWQRAYVGFHSNAGDGTSRGAIGLYDTRIQSSYPSTYYPAQTNLAAALARQCNLDLRAGTNSGVIPSWSTRTTYLYGSAYGEIYNSSVFFKMDTTINEVAFHDNEADCVVLKSPAGREWLGRATARGLIKHLSGYYPSSGIVNTNAPDRPVNLKAVNSGVGAVTVSWAMPARDDASGGYPHGFVLYTSTDGRGFGNPIAVPGASATNKVITNLNAGATIFFRVCATNAGGESFHSAVAGVRVTASGNKAGVLVVDGFKRNDYTLSPTRYFSNTLNGVVTLVRPRMINSFDYVKEHGLALAAAGQTFDYLDATLVTSGAVLTNYAKVVWILGEESTVDETFSSTEQAAVTNYLGNGGRLMVSGAEIGWDLGRVGVSSAADLNFFTNVLRAGYVTDSGGTSNVTGTATGCLSGVALSFNYTNLIADVYAANWPDVLKAGNGAVTAAVYVTGSSTNGAVIQYSNATYRTLVMGVPFETVLSSATRETVMTRAMTFLGDTVQNGAVKVTLTPAAVTNTARWVVNNTTNVSGSVRTGLVPGPYQVTFTALDGYTAPPATSIVISAAATTLLTCAYTESSGSLMVNLLPDTAVADGRWSVDGGTNWRTSGSVLSGLTSGTYTVTFQDIDSHTAPAASNVTVSGSTTSSVTGVYVAQVGDLTVNLSPAAAVSGGAAWSVDGGATWYGSGETATNLLAGRQYYTFKDVAGYTVPDTAYTTIIAGTNIVRSYSYTALPGSITMTLTPPEAVAAGAMWSLDGGANWNESGATLVDLPITTYTITFGAATGYYTPAASNYVLSAGEAASLSGAYAEIVPVGADCIKSQGFDDLDVNPWNWSAVYLDNAGVVTNVSHGATATTSVSKVLSGTTAFRLQGSTNGAANPAILLSNVDISGYTNVTLTVPFAAAGPDSGDDLHVSVSYDGGATWSPSVYGTQIADGYSGLSLDYNVLSDTNRQPQGTPYVLAVADIRTQIMVRIIFYDAASANSGDYYYLDEIQLKGEAGSVPPESSALKVTIQPAGAVSSGAQWRVDGGAWRASGAVATGLVAGIHTASFSTASGWTTPADIVTQTTNSTTNALTVTYTEAPSSWPTIFADDFEDGDLAGWTQGAADHWTNSSSGPVTGSRSLKHNLSSVESTSYIYAQPVYALAGTQTVWRFNLKNGNWDPSADNRFWVYLLANESDLGGATVDGYVVGINLSGAADTVTLWRVSNGAAAATIVQSTLDWDTYHTNGIEVSRSADGLWELKLDNGGSFNNLVSAGTGSDTTYSDTTYFGLYFDYTSTRAGYLWMDDISIWQTNSVVTDADGDNIPDWWEFEHYGSATGSTASADWDGDGATDWDEWLALTQPTNRNSVFSLDIQTASMGGTNVVSWPSATGRTYSLYWNVNLTSTFGTVVSGLPATPSVNVYTDSAHAAESPIYYRVKVTK